ncbi:hypothetical protein ALC53_01631 [Atta colombica]|uniref:Uncharacterized protein n=1 Tax=Atta colombica TaxID=520822 RepID=A0A195BUC3_9HYME|nr:hypothetical protein ALC53_01631 [Atta colombica]
MYFKLHLVSLTVCQLRSDGAKSGELRQSGVHPCCSLLQGSCEQVMRVSVKVDLLVGSCDDQVYGIINGSVDVNARRDQEAGWQKGTKEENWAEGTKGHAISSLRLTNVTLVSCF